MYKTILRFTILSLVYATPITVNAENSVILQDVIAQMNSKLSAKRFVRKERIVHYEEEVCVPRKVPCSETPESSRISSDSSQSESQPLCIIDVCRKVPATRREIYTAPANLMTWQTISVNDLRVDESQMVELPDKIYVKFAEGINCSNTAFPISETLTITTSKTLSSSTTKGISSSATISGSISFRGKVGWGGQIGGSHTKTVNLSRTEAETETETIVNSYNMNVSVPPGTFTRHELLVKEYSLRLPFSGNITVEGSLDANLDGIRQLSELLDTTERTLEVSGYISITSASGTRHINRERPVTIADCEGSEDTRKYREGDGEISENGISTYLGRIDFGSSKSKPPANSRRQNMTKYRAEGGGVCYIGPCNMPFDGYRPVCYSDENWYCQDCQDEYDPVCEPIE